MSSGRVQRIQDSVHGLMEFRGMEASAIDLLRTPELQRLRKIRQLGLAHLVFPGAEHSRLVHSLGACHLAVRFGRHLEDVARDFLVPALCPADDSIRDFAIAALCHDLGHGPLSHAWEREIIGDRFSREVWHNSLGLPVDDPLVPPTLKWHEMVGHALLAWEDGQLHRLLEQQETGSTARIRRMLSGKYFLPYLPRLLASDVDVDRADFVRRDTHQTGVAYGRYDLDWLISTSTVGQFEHPGGSMLVVGFDGKKSVRVLEQFLIARRALYETVYHHKTVRCAEGMVALFLRRLRRVLQEGQKLEVAGFVDPVMQMIRGNPIAPHEVLNLDDFALSVLIDSVAHAPEMDVTARDLALRIISRDLFKIVPLAPQKINGFLRQPHAYEKLHDAIKPFCRGESEYYIVVDTAKFTMLSEGSAECAFIIGDDKKAIPAHDHETLRGHHSESPELVRLFTVREAIPSVVDLISNS